MTYLYFYRLYRLLRLPRLHLFNVYHTYKTYKQCKLKKWAVKKCLKSARQYWLRLMHHKSGWVARSLAKKKGKRV